MIFFLRAETPEEFKRHVAVQAAIEIGFEKFLKEKNYQAVVTHFGDLGSLQQLPGLAMQRLMEKGYGFGAEGDWAASNGNPKLSTLTKILPSAILRTSSDGMRLHSENNDGWM